MDTIEDIAVLGVLLLFGSLSLGRDCSDLLMGQIASAAFSQSRWNVLTLRCPSSRRRRDCSVAGR
jgi:hypothetical protein